MSKHKKYLDEEVEIVLSLKTGNITHPELSQPDNHIETGLAHVFFFGDTVLKHYKLEEDENHFIKGRLAPTPKRHEFIQHDFKLNSHFGGGVYKKLHSHIHEDGAITLGTYEEAHPYVLIEMDKLDFSTNLHEQLLRQEVSENDLYKLGYFTAESLSEIEVNVPETANWYDLAKSRVAFLRQFVDWLPEGYSTQMKEMSYVDALDKYLDDKQEVYEKITNEQLTVSLDNHDENVFFKDGKPLFIDVVPPMDSWWFGLPLINLANLVVNVSALLSDEAAGAVERGYKDFHNINELPEEYAFTKALATGISVAHFGSIPEKKEVADAYIKKCRAIRATLLADY